LWTDPVSGISYARARWYDARTGAFLSEDPLRDVDSPNLYQYATWDVFNKTDPLGLCFFGLTDRDCWGSAQRSVASAAGALVGMAESAWEVGAGLVSLPMRMWEADSQRKRERLLTYAEGGYEAYEAIGERQTQETVESARNTAIALVPGVGTYREGSRIASECAGTGFECGRQIGRTAFSAGTDATAVYGGYAAVRGSRAGVPQRVGDGPVEFRPPPGATPEQVQQAMEYCRICNEALEEGAVSPTGRVSTQGQLRADASRAAAAERTRAANAGTPYQGHAGHVPDTTWTGVPEPYRWLDLDSAVNLSLGGQAAKYPVGYRPTEFILRVDGN
jgi:RHS repeat-associated protein